MKFLEQALCAETDPELFYGDGPVSDAAKAVCFTCDAFGECLRSIDLTAPKDSEFGFQAGMNVKQRVGLRVYDSDLLKYVAILDEVA